MQFLFISNLFRNQSHNSAKLALIRLNLTLSQTKNFILKEFANDNLKFDECGRKFFKQVENTGGKGEIAHYEQFHLFPLFSIDLYCNSVRSRACLGKG